MRAFRLKPFRLFAQAKGLYLLWLFLLIFPKGGVKIAGIPLTWGYFLLGLFTIFTIFRNKLTLRSNRTQAFVAALPFQFISLMTCAKNGIDSYNFAFSFLMSFFFLPSIFFLFFSHHIESMNLDTLFKLLKKGVFFISAYGIFLFLYKLTTGKFIEIPFFTVNFHDLGELESKNIKRGLYFKLISTYNNGNIYGICLLILLPLYLLIEKTTWKRFLVKSSLILTLSRTVWIGWIFCEIIIGLSNPKKTTRSLLAFAWSIAITFFVLISIGFYFGFDFLFDKSLGGRIDQFECVKNAALFSERPFQGIHEITYLSILSSFGILGLLSYLVFITGPILITLGRPLCQIQKAILCGLVNFLFLSFSDGAVLFIPVMAFYWFLCSLLLRKDFSTKNPFDLSPSRLGFPHHVAGST